MTEQCYPSLNMSADPERKRVDAKIGILMERSGFADLPLHGGRVPSWLAERMTKLGAAITENVLHHYGTSGFFSRLSDPFWFQALGAVMGMDWESTFAAPGAEIPGRHPTNFEVTPKALQWTAKRWSRPADSLPRSTIMQLRTVFSFICTHSS